MEVSSQGWLSPDMEMKGGVPFSPNKASGRARKGGSNRISFSEKTPKLVASK